MRFKEEGEVEKAHFFHEIDVCCKSISVSLSGSEAILSTLASKIERVKLVAAEDKRIKIRARFEKKQVCSIARFKSKKLEIIEYHETLQDSKNHALGEIRKLVCEKIN